MPRHPINGPSDYGYFPYNAIGSLVNSVQSLFSKGGDYINDPIGQLDRDAGAVNDAVTNTLDYYKYVPNNYIKADAKAFFSNPDNYFHAAEDALAIIGGGKFAISNGLFSSVPQINIAEQFTLKGASGTTTVGAVADGSYYSVAYEMKLPSNLYPGKGYYTHFKAANESLHAAMQSDASFSSAMQQLGITIPKSAKGTILGKSPENWVWHHDIKVGVMQLTLKSQHTVNSIFWNTMHPGGVGGMSTWGK